MKYLILCLLLIGCTKYNNCPTWNPEFIYGTKVEIISGFYKGQIGYIIEHAYFYNVDKCNEYGFKVAIIKHRQNVDIKQDQLKKVIEQEPEKPYEVKSNKHHDELPYGM